MIEEKQQLIRGGGFLIEQASPESVFTPEDYNEEQHMLRKSIRDFLDKEIEPNKAIFDSKAGTELAPKKLELLGDLGFLGLAVPEELGGFGCDIKTNLAASEILSDSFSFSQTLGIQRGLGINTILFYGNEAQRDKYLAGIISGKIKCAYCLTEPGAGSDANSGKTKAQYSADGQHFILNGQKMWITNSGFADVFSVFCKIEEDPHLSCILVEKEMGVKLGAEERKLGIHGSSTRQVFFENVKVPVANLLGERNKGFKIAMNALNMGRLMIGVAGSGVSKRGFRLGVSYANQRVQFGKKISKFGAIQEKIARMAIRIFAIESSWNRLGGDMDNLLEQLIETGTDPLVAKQRVASDFASECAMIKVFGSEYEHFVIDEALQMHGGMGYSAESDISVIYRNIRGNRIYEGTNEINRQVIPGTILKYAFSGQLPLMEATMQAMQSLQSEASASISSLERKEEVLLHLAQVKRAVLLVIGIAVQKYQQQMRHQQEILMRMGDLLAHLYFLESTLLRCLKHLKEGNSIYHDIMLLYLSEVNDPMQVLAKEIIFHCSTPEAALSTFKSIKSLFKLPVLNTIALRKRIAQFFIEKNEYKI